MDYLEKAIKEIRENWFCKHEIKRIEGTPGFQKIILGQKGTSMYQVEYILSGGNVFISGDLGYAIFELTEMADINRIKNYNISYLMGKWKGGDRDKYEFDERKARKQIKSHFQYWFDNEGEVTDEEKELLRDLIDETKEWSTPQQFSQGVYNIYLSTDVDWFDSECTSVIADCGQRLSYSVIAYWVGLKMISELLEGSVESEVK